MIVPPFERRPTNLLFVVLFLGLLGIAIILAFATPHDADASAEPSHSINTSSVQKDYSSYAYGCPQDHMDYYGQINWGPGAIFTSSRGYDLLLYQPFYSNWAGGWCSAFSCYGISHAGALYNIVWTLKEAIDDSWSFWSLVWCS